jgi:opacity protein-like surface antigen
MLRTTIAALMTATAITAASASDLPKRSAPVAPAPAASDSGFYAGVNAGVVRNENDATFGASLGYQFNNYLRAEGTYDYRYNEDNSRTKLTSSTVMGNAIVQFPIGSFTPYALAGTGYRWSDLKNEQVWNAGGGIRYNVMRNVDVDARYRYVANYDNKRDDNVFTVGLNFKF